MKTPEKNPLRNEFYGFYLPSVFYMEISTDASLDNLNELPEWGKATFFHEYTHFLQDLTTTFGLTNIINTVNVQKALNDEILKLEPGSSFDIPVDIKAYEETDSYNKLNTMFYGDFKSDFNEESSITDIQLVENGWIDGHRDKVYVEVIYVNGTQTKSFRFGAVHILESMAHLIERSLFDEIEAPVFPYHTVERMVNYLYPEIQSDDKMLVLLCDYALMAPDPGKFLFQFVNKLKELKRTSESEIYETLKFYMFNSPIMEKMSVFQLFENRYELALQSIKQYFTIELYDEIKRWLDTLFEEISTYRLEHFNFWSEILELPTKSERQSALINLTHRFGFPLISNNSGEIAFYHPKHELEHALIFKAIHEVFEVLSGYKTACGMMKCCENGINGDITNSDCFRPWVRGSQDPLCPFGQVIRMWGLSVMKPGNYRH